MSTDTASPERAAWLAAARSRHEAALVHYATHLADGNAARARETVQAIFAHSGELPDEAREDAAGEWLFTACRKQLLGGEGRAGRITDEGTHAGPAEPALGAAYEGEPPHVTMQRLIGRLTPKQREAVRLRFQNGFSYQSIARITELTAANVGGLIHHAVARLAREFGELQPGLAPKVPAAGAEIDPRLTAYALNEMEETERRSFENALRDKKATRARVDAIVAVSTQISQTLAIEAGAPAPRTVRRRTRAAGSRRWLFLLGLAALAGGIFYAWHRLSDNGPPAGATRDFSFNGTSWKPSTRQPSDEPQFGDSSPATEGATLATGTGVPPRSGPLSSDESDKPAMSDAASHHGVSRADLPTRATDEPPRAEDGDLDATRHGGAPTGPVPQGVSAVPRGQSGERQRDQESKASEGSPTDEASRIATPVARENAEELAAPSRGLKSSSPIAASRASPAGSRATTLEKKRAAASHETPRAAPGTASRPDVNLQAVVALKRALRSRQMPPRAVVRVGELVNYFPYHYAPPEGNEAFAASLESAEAPWNPAHRLVRIGLKGRERPAPPRPPATLVFVLDVSSSMDAPNRLPLVQEAVRLLLGRLRPDDRVGVITYAGESQLTLPPTPVTAARKIREALARLEGRGQTNGGAGLELAHDLVTASPTADGGLRHVILCTDGGFNLGPVSVEELTRLVKRWPAEGVRLSAFGFGRSDRLDARLEALAKIGDGQSGYVNTRREAERAFAEVVDGSLEPLAQDMKVEIAFNPEKVASYRLLGYEDDGPTADPEADAVARAVPFVLPGHTMTALYEVEPAATRAGIGAASRAEPWLTGKIGYTEPRSGTRRAQEFAWTDAGGRFAQASGDFKFATAVALFGRALRNEDGSDPRAALAQVEAWARESLGDDAGGYRSEFLAMVAQARAGLEANARPK